MDPPSNSLSAAFSSRNLTPCSKRKTKRLVTSKSNSCPTGRAAGAESSRSQESGSHGDRNHGKPPPWRWLENVKKSGKENPPEVKVFKSYLFNNKPGHFASGINLHWQTQSIWDPFVSLVALLPKHPQPRNCTDHIYAQTLTHRQAPRVRLHLSAELLSQLNNQNHRPLFNQRIKLLIKTKNEEFINVKINPLTHNPSGCQEQLEQSFNQRWMGLNFPPLV